MIDIKIKNKRYCTGCYGCYNICPQVCISMEIDNDGFYYPKVNYDKCIKCNLCIAVCPMINKTIITNIPKAYACINNDESIRLESSSGGIFTSVAERVIEDGGVVFGVAFDEDFKAIHTYVENSGELRKLRGSKYVQSIIGNTYKQAKIYIEQGRKVLFTGTPCQISGLKSYLGKDYDHLFCMDIICHGVPSPKVWERYISYREEKACSHVRRIAFRHKDKGWKQYSVLFEFQNNTEYRETHNKDYFMRAFLKDICLRPSCYSCKFKTIHRESDITLADFWGIQRILPEMDDDKGTSLVFVNSCKGQTMLEKIKDRIIYERVDIEQAVLYNSSAIKSAKYNPKREKFINRLGTMPFDKLVQKYCNDKMFTRINRKIRFIVRVILKKVNCFSPR